VRIEKVIAAEPDHGRALGYGAGVLAILGEADRTKEWIERGALLDPNNTILHFNFTCALRASRRARCGRRPDGRFIDKASPGLLLWFDNDTDLDPLREASAFIEIMRTAKARFAAAGQQDAGRPAAVPS
jgi:adenylate cyclase